MTGYYDHTVADGVNSLCLSANKGGKVSLITKCVASWNRKRKSGTPSSGLMKPLRAATATCPPPPNTEDGSLLVV